MHLTPTLIALILEEVQPKLYHDVMVVGQMLLPHLKAKTEIMLKKKTILKV